MSQQHLVLDPIERHKPRQPDALRTAHIKAIEKADAHLKTGAATETVVSAYIAELHLNGFTVVPRWATKAMIRAAAEVDGPTTPYHEIYDAFILAKDKP
jgi:hypothetical protein